MSATEIAKLMRKDIKEAQKRGQIPTFAKICVRVYHHSSIEITVTQWQGSAYTEEYKAIANQYSVLKHMHIQRYTDALQTTMQVLEDIHCAYNRNNSDTTTDYFDVNYYGVVKVDYNLR